MSISESGQALNQKLTVVDAHHDLMLDLAYRRGKGEHGALSGFWGPKLRAAGVNIQLLPMYVEGRYLPDLGIHKLIEQIDHLYADLQDDDSEIQLATTMTEADEIIDGGKIAAVLALEGCDGLGGDPAILRVLYRLGLRMVGLTWFGRNAFADGSDLGESAGGLTPAGKTALKDMNDHNVICDVSHLAEPGFWDVANLNQGPFVASHSNARAVFDHHRNLTDDQLRAIAESGGVVGLNFYGGFIDEKGLTLNRLIDHLSHIIDTIGIEHVGIGPDFLDHSLREVSRNAIEDGGMDPDIVEIWVPECERIEQLPNFTAAMLERGYSEDEIEMVMGGNFRRVFQEVWG